MARFFGIFACLIIVAMDVAAGILGIEAEVAQNQEKHLRIWIFECKEPSHEAFVLSLGAIGLLATAHILSNLLGGCNIFTPGDILKANPTRQLSYVCIALTWIVLAVAMGMMVIGLMANSKSKASCGFSHHHFLSIGGILCMVHSLFAVSYYVTATAALGE